MFDAAPRGPSTMPLWARSAQTLGAQARRSDSQSSAESVEVRGKSTIYAAVRLWSSGMNGLVRLVTPFALWALPFAVQAESLRCNGASAAEGDSKLSVLYKCGQPLLSDSFCAPVFYQGTLHPVPQPIAGALVPCQPVEEWIYDRGQGNLMATVRFRDGRVQSIRYGQQPR